MRDNSGQGDSKNNLRDPTLKEHEAQGGHKPQHGVPGAEATISGNARERGEDPSPDDRARGETSVADPAAPIDAEQGR
jgi:hypothetical protein